MFLPARTPRAIVDKLADDRSKTMEQPALRERFAGLDVDPDADDAAEFDALVRRDIVAKRALAKAAGLQTELSSSQQKFTEEWT